MTGKDSYMTGHIQEVYGTLMGNDRKLLIDRKINKVNLLNLMEILFTCSNFSFLHLVASSTT